MSGESTAVATANWGQNLPTTKHEALEKDMMRGAGFLPRVQLVDNTSAFSKKKLITAGNYVLIFRKDQFKDLTAEVEVIPVAWRPLALDSNNEPPLFSHNPESERFKRITEAATKPGEGFISGPDFLVWIPAEKTFATYLMGSKSAKRVASDLNARMHQMTRLKSYFVEKEKWSWWAPSITPSTSPMPPSPADIAVVVEKFLNPEEPEETKEEAGDADESKRAR